MIAALRYPFASTLCFDESLDVRSDEDADPELSSSLRCS